jgi:hypothetical protein
MRSQEVSEAFNQAAHDGGIRRVRMLAEIMRGTSVRLQLLSEDGKTVVYDVDLDIPDVGEATG